MVCRILRHAQRLEGTDSIVRWYGQAHKTTQWNQQHISLITTSIDIEDVNVETLKVLQTVFQKSRKERLRREGKMLNRTPNLVFTKEQNVYVVGSGHEGAGERVVKQGVAAGPVPPLSPEQSTIIRQETLALKQLTLTRPTWCIGTMNIDSFIKNRAIVINKSPKPDKESNSRCRSNNFDTLLYASKCYWAIHKRSQDNSLRLS